MHANQRRMSRHATGWRLIRVVTWAVLMIGFWVVFSFLDPVAIERATRESSDAFAMSVTAPLYGSHVPPAQRHVAVVEIDDNSLTAFKETWPLKYASHAAILRSILNAGAAGVMVDIRFAAEREGQSLSAFKPAIDLARERGVRSCSAGARRTTVTETCRHR